MSMRILLKDFYNSRFPITVDFSEKGKIIYECRVNDKVYSKIYQYGKGVDNLPDFLEYLNKIIGKNGIK